MPRQVEVGTVASPKTGKGYLNSFQDDRLLEPAARQEAFRERLQRFLADGGKLDDVIELQPLLPDLLQLNPVPNPPQAVSCGMQVLSLGSL